MRNPERPVPAAIWRRAPRRSLVRRALQRGVQRGLPLSLVLAALAWPSLAAWSQPGPPPPAPTGLLTIESDSQKADNLTGIITAIGNVRILYPDRRLVATSRQAQYFTNEGRIVLSGDVDVVQEGGNLVQAERVIYLVESEQVLAQPAAGQQVFSQLRLQDTPPAADPLPLP